MDTIEAPVAECRPHKLTRYLASPQSSCVHSLFVIGVTLIVPRGTIAGDFSDPCLYTCKNLKNTLLEQSTFSQFRPLQDPCPPLIQTHKSKHDINIVQNTGTKENSLAMLLVKHKCGGTACLVRLYAAIRNIACSQLYIQCDNTTRLSKPVWEFKEVRNTVTVLK